jgi:hypothetical protein
MIVSIIKSYLNNLNVKELKSTSKRIGIKGYSKLNKEPLICNIVMYIAVKKIQRFYRKSRSVNNICPISLDEIFYPCWSKKTISGNIYYNLEPLANYLISRGDFRDPITRNVYSNDELESIDKLVKKCNLKIKKSVRKAKDNKKYYKRKKDHEEQVDILLERTRFIILTIKEKIDDLIYDCSYKAIENLNLNLEISYFPTIKEYIYLLNRLNKQYLKILFSANIEIVKEIKVHNKSISHMKNLVLNWLEHEKNNI